MVKSKLFIFVMIIFSISAANSLALPSFTYKINLSNSNFVVLNSSDNIVYTNSSFQDALQWSLKFISLLGGGDILVRNPGVQITMDHTQANGYSPQSAVYFTSPNINVWFEPGTNIKMLNDQNWGLFKLDGRWMGINITNSRMEGMNGTFHIIGAGTYGGEKGIYLRDARNNTFRNIEISNTAEAAISFDADAGGEAPAYNDNNTFENLYIHEWAQGIYTSLGFGIDGSYNRVINVTMDGMNSGQTRSALYFGAETSRSHDNVVIGGQFLNTRYDNGIYMNSWAHSVDHNFLTGFTVSGNHAGGHSGLKLRPSSYNVITNFTSENNHYGIDTGTVMPGETPAGTENDAGRPFDGWNRGNYIQGTLRDNDVVGLVVTADSDGLGVENNTYDLVITGSPNGIWFANGAPNAADGFEQNNTFYVNIDNCTRGIVLDGVLINGSNRNNHITGIINNSGQYAIYIANSNSYDNRFDVAIDGSVKTVTDNGTRNRINGIGRFAYGAGNIPNASQWDIGDVVINTDDNAYWLKDADGTMKLQTQPKSRFVYFTNHSGIPQNSFQFIDESYDPNGTVSSWSWSFGDGNYSNSQYSMHSYSSFGSYMVCLNITDNKGKNDSSCQIVQLGVYYVTISGSLRNSTDIVEANVSILNTGTDKINTSQVTSNGVYSLSFFPGIYDLQYNIFFIPDFFVKLISVNVFNGIQNILSNINKLQNGLSFVADVSGGREIRVYSQTEPIKILKNGGILQNVSSYSDLTINSWFYNSSESIIYINVDSS